MNWLDIFCFTSVGRTQSFSVTAREMRISQQAVSSHIRKLEAEVGFPLFQRDRQNIKLTRAGQAMLAYFSAREELITQLDRTLHPRQSEKALRIGWSQWTRCPAWFQKGLHVFESAHPDIRVDISDLDMWELQRALENDEIDLLLTTSYVYSRLPIAWSMRVMSEEPLILLGSRQTEYDLEHLDAYPYIACYAQEADERGVRARVMRECTRLGFIPRQIIVCPDMGSACLNILLKGGITLGSRIAPLEGTESFVFLPTQRTATTVLCRPYGTSGDLAAQFESCLIDCMEILP